MSRASQPAGEFATITAVGTGAWIRVRPFRANASALQVIWSGTTAGASVRIQAALTTGSTAPTTILQRRTTNASVQVQSTVSATFGVIRVVSSGGGTPFSAAKTARVFWAAAPA